MSAKKRRDLTAEEAKLWSKVAASVRARRMPPPTDSVEVEAPIRAPVSRDVVKPAKPAKPAIPPQNRRNEKNVRRGKLEVDASLDLHGKTQDGARAALKRFLHGAQRRGYRVIVVITGVGRGGEGVLKRRLPDWLSDPDIAPMISGYAPAHRAHGGAGAFYVFIKRLIET